MTYLVLARKYRPHQFSEMVGQAHVLQALQNALTQQRLHHAYLFTGTRGVGKTTIARIFAKCLNCEQGISPNPCGTCTSCKEIDEGRHIDLLEIDAASHTKVESTRELLDNVQYNPQRGRFKIYLIDEVHMLSGHSFNALLKTLEEPPPHVKFLLATTDPQRLPVTVLSRCLQFHLKNMSPNQIVAQLITVLEKEQLAFTPDALMLIAQAAQGSMRDALSILDQAIAYSGGHVVTDTITAMLGLTAEQHTIELLQLLAQKNAQALLQKIDVIAEVGADFLTLLNDLLSWFHRIAVVQITHDNNNDTLKQFAQQFSPEDIQLYYQIALVGKKDLPFAPDAKTGFSMVMVRMLAFTLHATKTSPTPSPIKSQATPQTMAPSVPSTTTTSTPISSAPIAATSSQDDKILSPENAFWAQLLPQLPLTGITRILAQHCALITRTDEHFELLLEENQMALLTPAAKTRLIDAIKPHVGNACQISVHVGKSPTASPAKVHERLQQEKLQSVQQQLLGEPQLQSLMEKFSAALQPDSLVVNE